MVKSFSDSTNIGSPSCDSKHPANRFDFSEQHFIGQTLETPTVSTWVRFDSSLVT
ncbi:hypothetical protein BFV94_4478 [Alteromonas macleodii]|nr:hypothetical protein BFV94_4478 [Alteromonas macleodii]OES25442.1 hypothetical protein BFV93_4448 [Alteromonas macleodii]